MVKKYDIDEIEERTDKILREKTIDKKTKEMEEYIDNISKIKELDEQNPLEQAIKYRAVKQNLPEPGYMEVRLSKDKTHPDRIISESDIYDDNGDPTGRVKRLMHDSFYTVDLKTLLQADITACPSSVGPMLIDMAQKKVEIKKRAFTVPTRRAEFNWWWIVIILLLVPGIITVILMMLNQGG